MIVDYLPRQTEAAGACLDGLLCCTGYTPKDHEWLYGVRLVFAIRSP